MARLAHRTTPLPFVRRWRGKTLCPVCRQHVQGDERSYLRTLLDGLREPEFTAPFQASFGLCLPHLVLAIEGERHHPELPTLVHLQIQKLTTCRGKLQEIIRKFDYRFAAELTAAEGAEWRRAIELFVGKPAVFGNDCRALEPRRS
jgi:hypothetical protein